MRTRRRRNSSPSLVGITHAYLPNIRYRIIVIRHKILYYYYTYTVVNNNNVFTRSTYSNRNNTSCTRVGAYSQNSGVAKKIFAKKLRPI